MNTIKIPTVVALLFLTVLITTLVLIGRYTNVVANADIGKQPKDVMITSVTDSGFTVTWQTAKPTRGFVSVKRKENPQSPLSFFDERDGKGSNEIYSTHSVIVRGLEPQTAYTVSILSHEKAANASQFTYDIATGPTLTQNTNQLGPAYGTVLTQNGKPAEGALVYVTLPGSQTVSTMVKPSGSFVVPLNLIRTEDFAAFLPIEQERLPMTITVKYQDLLSTATTDTLNDSPVPEMLLGETYDFRGSQVKKKESREDIAHVKGMQSLSSVLGSQDPVNTKAASISLLTPEKNGAVASFFPFVTGTGIPESIVTISIGSPNPEVGTTKVLMDGTWKYSPKKAVGIGKQSVTMSTIDDQKKPVAITHLFEVLKSGTQVLGDATPSAIPTFSIPTSTPVRVPTSTAAPVPTNAVFTPTPTIPETATTFPTVGLLAVGILAGLMGLGLLIR